MADNDNNYKLDNYTGDELKAVLNKARDQKDYDDTAVRAGIKAVANTSKEYSELVGRVAEQKANAYTDTAISTIPSLDWDNLQDKPSEYPPVQHLHGKSDITDFAHRHEYSEIDSTPPPYDDTVVKTDIANLQAIKADITYLDSEIAQAKSEATVALDGYKSTNNLAVSQLDNDIKSEVSRATTAEQVNAFNINTINDKIDPTAFAKNKLISENRARAIFANGYGNRVTYTVGGDPFPTHIDLVTATVLYHAGQEYIPSNNDFCTVQNDENHNGQQAEYVFDGTGWVFSAVLGLQPFTTEQEEALNSGVNAGHVAKLNSVDNTVTAASPNLITSGAVASQLLNDLGQVQVEIDKKQDKLASGTNIKTLNGVSLLGSGDIPSTVVDNLTSTSTTQVLSANMGRVLNEKIEEMTVIDDLFVQFECEGTMGEGIMDVFGYGEFKLEQVPMHTKIRSENDLVKLYGNARVEFDHGIEMMGGGILGDMFQAKALVLDNGVLYLMIFVANEYGDIFTIPDAHDRLAFTFVSTTPNKQYPNLWTNTQKFREPITDVDVIEKYKQVFADVSKNK